MAAAPRQSAYNGRWKPARAGYLAKHRWCVQCLQEGRRVQATEVDHIRPHRGDMRLFWKTSNWQALCKRHHSAKTGREGPADKLGSDARGLPLDRNDPWVREYGKRW